MWRVLPGTIVALKSATANAQTILNVSPPGDDGVLETIMPAVIGMVGVVIGAIIAAWGTRYVVDRQVLIKNVTEERAKWRERIRSLAAELEDAARTDDARRLAVIHTSIKLSLNPDDVRDQQIVSLIRQASEKPQCRLEHVDDAVSLLARVLKHDWQRAKVEAGDGTWQDRHAWRRSEKRRHKVAGCERCLAELEAKQSTTKACGCPR